MVWARIRVRVAVMVGYRLTNNGQWLGLVRVKVRVRVG